MRRCLLNVISIGILLLCRLAIYAQNSGPLAVLYVSSDPTGSCGNIYITVNISTGNISGCKSGTWQTIGGANAAFSSITAGTNTAALIVGTGGSLATTGSGTIAATSLASVSCTSLVCPTFTPTAPFTESTQVPGCYDGTLTVASNINAGSATTVVNIGTAPAGTVFTWVTGRESTTFAFTGAATATVSVGYTGNATGILPTTNLMGATNNYTPFTPIGSSAGFVSTTVTATFVITTGGLNWNTGATAGTYVIRVCTAQGL